MCVFNNKILIAVAVIMLATINTSCFKEEPLNAECDIETAWLHVDNVNSVFYSPTDTLINVISTENRIIFSLRDNADITALAPQFTITDGATISPASGSVHDFSKGPVTYTVTSQDGKWKRIYTVECVKVSHFVTDFLYYNFENFELDSKYHKFYVWHNTLPNGTLGNDWASGNEGYYIARGGVSAENYPTTILENGYEGYGVKLTTQETGPYGRLSGKPIAAGNMFLGKFDSSQAMVNAMLSTRFGVTFDQKPLRLEGYYQYSPGSPFVDKKFNTYPDRIDAGDIYSVLYINHDRNGNPLVLFGDNVLTSDNIVAVARVNNVNETNGEWVKFDVEYEYLQEFDYEILAEYGYSFTIVFSSSINGASFEGALGSTLKVDKVKLTCETKE